MKITCIELFHISIPLVKPYKLTKQYGTLTHAQAVICKVFTDEGIIGLGEADPLKPFTPETPELVMSVIKKKIAPKVIGKDPTNISEIESNIDKKVEGNLMARGAINMALFDITGKSKNVPTHTFLGKLQNPKIPMFIAIGSGTPDEDSKAIEVLINKGYRGVMIKMGALSIPEEIERMISARKHFGDKIAILVDANQGWTIDETLEFIEGVKGFFPDLLEQPVKRDDLKGLKHIRNHSKSLISADESINSIQDAKNLIQAESVDVFSVKVSKNGGLNKSKAIADLAQSNGIKCLMNSMIEFGISQAASLQLACTLPNLVDTGHAYGSVLRMADDITNFAQNISHSIVTVPSSPGLGVFLNEKKLKKYTQNFLRID